MLILVEILVRRYLSIPTSRGSYRRNDSREGSLLKYQRVHYRRLTSVTGLDLRERQRESS